MYLLDKQKGLIAHYWNEGQNQFYLPARSIDHIYIDKENKMWLSSDGGLLKLSLNADQTQLIDYKQFTVSDGLPSNIIHAVYEDELGYLWLNTENGIAQFHKTTHFCKHYLEEDGIAHLEGNRISHYRDEYGRLYFGSVGGVSIFHPKDFSNTLDTSQSYIHIIDFQQYSRTKNDLESRIIDFKKDEKLYCEQVNVEWYSV